MQTMENKVQILLAEDDLNLGFLLVEFLESSGMSVKLSRDGEAALTNLSHNSYDLCIFDVMLPKVDGFTLAGKVRKSHPGMPVIFLTARSLKADKLKGYELGADDYITKPFDEDELLCRIRAVMNRVKADTPYSDQPIDIGSYTFDFKNQSLVRGNEVRRLTGREADILRMLCSSQNRIVRREDILTALWGENDYFAGRSLDVFISKLRKYFADDPNVRIENIPRVGFLLSCSVA